MFQKKVFVGKWMTMAILAVLLSLSILCVSAAHDVSGSDIREEYTNVSDGNAPGKDVSDGDVSDGDVSDGNDSDVSGNDAEVLPADVPARESSAFIYYVPGLGAENFSDWYSLTEAFAKYGNKSKQYTITVMEDVHIESFRIPTNAAKITMMGYGETVPVVSVDNTVVNPSVSVEFKNIQLSFLSSVQVKPASGKNWTAADNATMLFTQDSSVDRLYGNWKFALAGDDMGVPLVTVKNMDGKASIQLSLVNSQSGKTMMLPASTTVLLMDRDFSSQIVLAQDDRYNGYGLLRVGKQMQICTGTMCVSKQDFQVYFSSFEQAVSYINKNIKATDNAGLYFLMSVEEDLKTLVFPKVPITVYGNGQRLLFNGTAVSAPSDTVIQGLTVMTRVKGGYTFSASGNLTLTDWNTLSLPKECYGIKALKGNGAKTLTFESNKIDFSITGFKTVELGRDVTITVPLTVKQLTVRERCRLIVQKNLKAEEFYLKGKTTLEIKSPATLTVKNFHSESTQNSLVYYELENGGQNNFVPVNITGKLSGEENSLWLSVFQPDDMGKRPFLAGETLLKGKNIDKTVIAIDVSCNVEGSSENEYCLSCQNGNVSLARSVFLVENGNAVENKLYFAQWQEIKEYIEQKKNKEAEYHVNLLSDYHVGGPLTMPKAGTYETIRLTGQENCAIYFTGNLTLTGNLEIYFLDGLYSVSKAGSRIPKDFSVNLSGYRFVMEGVKDHSIKTITGSTKSTLVLLSVNIPGNVTAGNLMLGNTQIAGNVKAYGESFLFDDTNIGGSFTTEGLQRTKTGVTLTMNQDKKLSVGKKGFVAGNPALYGCKLLAEGYQNGINLRLTDKAGNLVSLSGQSDRGRVLASVTGAFTTGDLFYDAAENMIIRSGNNLVYAGTAEKLLIFTVRVGESESREYFLTYEDAVKEINRRKDKTAVYELTLTDDLFVKGSLMPAAKSCRQFIISSETQQEISYGGTLALTCDFKLCGVTLARKTGNKVLDQSINVNTYELDLAEGAKVLQLKNLSGKTNGRLLAESEPVTVYGNISGNIDIVSKGAGFSVFGNVAVRLLDASESDISCSFSVSADKTITIGTLKGPETEGANWEIVASENTITIKDYAGGNVTLGYSLHRVLKFTGKAQSTDVINLVPMKRTPEQFHVIASIEPGEKIVSYVSKDYTAANFALLPSVETPHGGHPAKKGTTLILEQ